MSRSSARRRGFRRAAILAVAIAAWALGAAGASAAVTATISQTAAFDFGNRQIGGGAATRTITVRSTGTDPLEIVSVGLGGADPASFGIGTDTCSARTAANPLTQNQSCSIQVTFDPQATGARSTVLQVATNGPTLTSGTLSGTGRDLALSSSALAFGSVSVGTLSATQTVTVTNEDAASYTLGAVAVSTTQFAKVADTCSATALAPGASCSVELRFAPTSLGSKSANLTIASHGPVPATLAGTGAQAATALSPATHDFGVLAADGGSSSPRSSTLVNSGNDPLQVGTAQLAGDAAASFAIAADACSGTTLAPGAACVVQVAFVDPSAGWRTATLRIPTSGAVSPVVARVSGRRAGTGADANPFLTPLVLGDLPLLRLRGDGEDSAGSAIASGACDVNDDGYDDVLVGAPLWSRTPVDLSWEGAAYVYLGGPGAGGADLASPPAGRVVRIEGEQEGIQTGAVGCAGDVDGDGVDDIAIGAWAYEYAGRPTGTAAPRGIAYVVFGARDLAAQTPLDLGFLADRGFRIEGRWLDEFDHFGYSVTGVGDLDDDGRGDLAVMANTADTTDATPARSNNGIVYVLRGQSGTQTLDAGDAARQLLVIHGASPGSSASPFGQMNSLAALGDVDGDDVGDVGIGSYTAVAFGRSTASGAAFAVSGAARGRIDLADADAPLFAVGGAFAGHRLGIGIAAAGDVNGDGLADVAIGADSTSSANSDAAYVVFGSDDPAHELLDAADLGTRGYRILGATGSSTGFSVDGVGDVNRDGRDDLLVGGYGVAGTAGAGAGAAWIVYGQDPAELPANDASSGLVPVNAGDLTHYVALASLTPAQGTKLEGQTAGERFARQVAAVGDIDGNGAADVAFGADSAFRHGREGAGEATVALLPGPVPAYTPPVVTKPDPPAAAPKPALVVRPRVTGSGRVGKPLTCEPGTWEHGPVALTYRWLRAGQPIRGATTAAYRPERADVGSLVACRVTAANAVGDATATAAGVRVVQPTVTRDGVRTAQAGPALTALRLRTAPAARGRLRLGTVRCVRAAAERCSVRVRAVVTVGGERAVLRLARTLAQGRQAQLALTLPAALRAALERSGSGVAVVRVTVRDDRGMRGTRSARIALVRR